MENLFITEIILDFYDKIQLHEINYNNLKHSKLSEILKKNFSPNTEIQKIGKSFLNKDIYLLKIGNGNKKILLWSQMHGNEPLSTLALLDFFNFLNHYHKNNIANFLRNNLTIYAIPMLNPDGADNFSRRNAQGIDINRDALALQSPEGQILMKFVKKINPNFAFNLHDQDIYYGIKNNENPTLLAFLAPSTDFEKTITPSREASIKVISAILRNLLPISNDKNIAKYNDEFYPTAFGDNIQKLGIPTILIEGGYVPNDENYNIIRLFYFLSILFAMLAISTDLYKNETFKLYEDLPFNQKEMFVDILIKNLKIKRFEKTFNVDIALWRRSFDPEDFSYSKDYFIKDIGDLKKLKSFFKYDCKSITFEDNNFFIQRNKKADFLLKFVNNYCQKL